MMRVLLVIAVLANTMYMVNSLCGLCMDNGVACVDVDRFQYCDSDGILLEPIYRCRNGTVCTSNTNPCSVPVKNNVALCDLCKKCNDDQIFACTTYNTFSLCYGTSTFNETVEYVCPENLVCNAESKVICTDPETEIGFTCPISTLVTTTEAAPTTVPTTTTVSPITNPNEYCKSEDRRGRYDIESDPKCSQFVECKQKGNEWYGTVYFCPGKTYFNPETQMCSKNAPPRCAPPEDVCD